jgi:shikimate kinase
MKKIILLGYMGSGKSTIGALVSKKLQLSFKDLDEIIESETKISINTIFKTKGEIYFRKLEHQVFKDLMSSSDSFVLSLGGGTLSYANNLELINDPSVHSIYLKASLEELCNRLSKDKSNRPLIANLDTNELKEFVGQHLFERSYYYNQASHCIAVDGKSPEEITEEIVAMLV